MARPKKEETIEIDGQKYAVSTLTDEAKMQIANINFVDERLQQLNNEWAVSDTARIAYTNALRVDLKIDG